MLSSLVLAAVLSQAPAAPPASTQTDGWTGTAGLALIWLTGNASTLTLNGNAAANRQWREWSLGFKAFGTYGTARAQAPGASSQVTALAAGGQLRGDRKLSDWVTVYLTSGLSTDHVKSVEASGFGEAGAGLTWVERRQGDFQKLLLRTDLAARYQRDDRFQYFPTPERIPSVDLLGPRVGLAFRYAPNKEVILSEDAEVIPTVLGTPTGRTLVNSISKLNAHLTRAAALTVAFAVNFDSKPAPGKVPTDTALTVGLEFAL